ncbi:MAG: hypothetical protein PHS54_04630 [Clostridia bacterium]|nr:hypothetical protein [Clostridia bacterium]
MCNSKNKVLECFYRNYELIIDDENKEHFIIGRGKPICIKVIEKAIK